MKKFLIIAAVICLTLLLGVASAEVLSTTPITDETFWGTRVVAVAVEYDKPFEAQEFALDAFRAEDLLDSGDAEVGYVMTPYENERIYTNAEAGLLDEGAVEGNYVIVEFVDDWRTCGEKGLGILVVNYFYTDDEGNPAKQDRWVKPNEGTVQQLADLTAKDGSAVAAMEAPMGMTNDYLHLGNVNKFELVQIPREEYPDRPYNALVALPDDYDESKEYPVVFNITGNSLLEWQIGDVNNVYDVLYIDRQLLSWTYTADYGFEDVIVVGLRHLGNVGAPEGIDKIADTAAAAQWIIDNYAIDKEHLYWTGQSMGAVTTFNVLNRFPELGTCFVAFNGGIQMQNDYADPENGDTYRAELREFLAPILENKIKLYIQFGEQDYPGCNADAAYAFEEVIIDYYANEMSLSDPEIAELLKVNVLSHVNWLVAEGLTDHNVVRLVNWYPERIEDMMRTVLSW